jgi:WD40 repeat protein
MINRFRSFVIVAAVLTLTVVIMIWRNDGKMSFDVPVFSSATSPDDNDGFRSLFRSTLVANGDTYVSSGYRGRILVRDVATGLTLHSLTVQKKIAGGVACNRDASLILVVCMDGSVVAFTRTDDRYRSKMLHRFKGLVVCDLSKDGGQALLGTKNGRVEIRDTESDKRLQLIATDAGWVELVQFSPDETRVLYACQDGTIHVWDCQQAAEVACFPVDTLPVKTAVFSPDGLRIATGHFDGWLHVWDAGSGSELCGCEVINSGVILSVDFSPCGRFVACGTEFGVTTVRCASECSPIATWPGRRKVRHVKFSPDGRTLYAAFAEFDARVRQYGIPQDQ